MAYAFVASVGAIGDGTNVTTGSMDTTGATILVVGAWDYSVSAAGVVTDSKSNTWTKLTKKDGVAGNVSRVTLWYAKNPTVGSGHTFTQTAGGFPSIVAMSFSGADTTSPFDVENGYNVPSLATLQTGSVTPNQANSLVVFAVNGWTAEPTSVDGTYTLSYHNAYGPGTQFAGGGGYDIQTTATATNPTITADASYPDSAAVIAVFKPLAAASLEWYMAFV